MMDIQEFAMKYHGLVIQPHQLKWIDFLERVKHRGILLAPRGHGKSVTINLIWLSWVIVNNPHLRILFISHSKEMAESFSRSIRNVMENEELQEEFGFNMGSPWRANSWRLEESPMSKPTLECKGAMGRMTGWRGDMVVFDDLLEINAVMTEALRTKVENWIKQEVLPAINPQSLNKVVVVGTRKHIDDWYGQLLQNPDYEQYTDTAFQDEAETEALWPHIIDEQGERLAEMWSAERLHAKKREIGALLFAQEYMNQPSPAGGMEFKMEWVRYYEHLPEYSLKYYMGVDPSSGSTQKRTNSYFAVTVVAHHTDSNNIYVVDMFKAKLSKEQQNQKAVEMAAQYAPERIFVENVFEYDHVYECLKQHFPNVSGKDYIHTPLIGVSAVKKEERIRQVVGPAFERNIIYLPRPEHHHYVHNFLEYEYRPFGVPNSEMDLLDSLVLAIHSITKRRRIRAIPWFYPS